MSIWNNKELKSEFETNSELMTLGEGDTPLEMVDTGNNNTLFLKREDLNPTGSWKDRGTAFKISSLKQQKIKEVVISSSGNAAISLLKYAKLYPELRIHIVVSPNVNTKKLDILNSLIKNSKHKIYFAENTKQKRAEIIKETGAKLFSSSQDNEIVKGYWSLGIELAKKIRGEQNKTNYLICAVSSGAALVGTVEGLMLKLENEFLIPKVIVCQPQSCPTIFNLLKNEPSTDDEKQSLADAIIDKTVLRSPQILKIIDQTNGDAHKITNEELKIAKDWIFEKRSLELSYNSLLSIASFLRISEEVSNSNFFCVVSGR